MLEPEQLSQSISKKVQEWSPQQVKLWFSLHSISTSPSFDFKKQCLDGKAFLNVSPQFLYEKCGITSNIIIKKIIQWIQQDREEFEQYIDDSEGMCLSQLTEKMSEKEDKIQFQPQNKQNTPENHLIEAINFKHREAVMPILAVQKWKCKQRKQQANPLKEYASEGQIPLEKPISKEVKYTQSSYEVCENTVKFEFNGSVQSLSSSGKVGRSNLSDIIFSEGSVSRQHAAISKLNTEYYLQDSHSKFGTYIEIGTDYKRPLEEGDFLAFHDYYIEILKIRIYRQKGKDCFDLNFKQFKVKKQSVVNLYVQKNVSIGRKDCDIIFDYPQIEKIHAFIIVKDSQLFLVKEQGESYLKLRRGELYHIEEEQMIRFGLQRVKVTLEKQSRPWMGDLSPYKLE